MASDLGLHHMLWPICPQYLVLLRHAEKAQINAPGKVISEVIILDGEAKPLT